MSHLKAKAKKRLIDQATLFIFLSRSPVTPSPRNKRTFPLTIIGELEAPTQQAFTDDSLIKAISRTSF